MEAAGAELGIGVATTGDGAEATSSEDFRDVAGWTAAVDSNTGPHAAIGAAARCACSASEMTRSAYPIRTRPTPKTKCPLRTSAMLRELLLAVNLPLYRAK
jgi:hypothetical protein